MTKVLVCLVITAWPWWAQAVGGDAGNGGQEIALDFTTFGFDIVGQLQRNFSPGSESCHGNMFSDLCDLDGNRLKAAIVSARVMVLPELTQTDPDTGKVLTYTALNYPQDQRVLVSEAEWRRSDFCYVKKLPLVLHEYLGLLGVEVQNYRYSSLFSEWLITNLTEDKFQGCLELYPRGGDHK